MLRRTIVFNLAFCLVSLVPLPLAACAIASGLEGQCQCPMMMQCAGMANSAATMGGAQISCQCVETAAPFPPALQNATTPAPSLLTASFLPPGLPSATVSFSSIADVPAKASPGPPGGRAGLCVFLI